MSSNDGPRPQNMFDITELSYEQYCDKHYAVLIEQMLMHQQHFAAQAYRGGGGRGAFHGGYRGGRGGGRGSAGYNGRGGY